ncbi:MAG: hypothetical protein FWC34_07590 [Bacteroidetes bacterium]|nr:hypothetical protein [Bacteroidota bacterium]MCL2303153.1 hypothetical protein [Lentimicrobiaceae bacterium]
MNTKRLLPILALFCLAVSCQTGSFTYYNDVFTRSTDRQYHAQREQRTQAQNERNNLYNDDFVEEEFYDEASVNAMAFDDFDMYDYFYTSRIRRFHTHVSLGWGFYDPFFTNMFWYTRSPATWGVSIYLGHSWWWPSPFWRPWHFDWGWYSWGFNWGWGWGWHNPWRFGGPWGGFPPGWNPGFWAGFHHNRFDFNNSFTFGHRNTIGPSGGRSGSRNVFGSSTGRGNNISNSSRMTTRSSGPTFNERYDNISRNPSPRNEGAGGRGSSASTVDRNDQNSERGTSAGTSTGTRQTGTSPGTSTGTRQVETRPGTSGSTTTRPGSQDTRQTETRPPTAPSTRQDTYNSGFRPDNSRSTPTHTPPSSSPSNRNSGSSFSSPSGSSGSSGRSSGSSAPSGGSGGSRNSGSGNTRR